jgi:hypothetical protein
MIVIVRFSMKFIGGFTDIDWRRISRDRQAEGKWLSSDAPYDFNASLQQERHKSCRL